MTGYARHLERLGRRLRQSLQGALAWWVEGLWIGVPQPVRQRLFETREALTVRFSGNAVVLERALGGRGSRITIPLDALTDPPGGVHADLDTIRGPLDVTVVLPDDSRLTKVMWLPAAAEADLRSVLYYELGRLTPFDVEQCAFDYVRRDRDDRNDRIAVELALVQRATLERFVHLARRIGLEPSAVTATNDEGERLPVNLLGGRRRLVLPRPKVAPSAAVVGVTLAVIAASLYAPLVRYQSLLENFERSVDAERKLAVEAREKLDAENAVAEGIDFLSERRRDYLRPVDLLAELTDALADDTWLSQFTVSQADLTIQGESDAPSGVLEAVESTESLEHAVFKSPVSRSQTTGKQQFSIVARLAEGS